MNHKREGNYEREVKGGDMIKGIIGYKVLDYKGVEPILMNLRSYAKEYPGLIGAEILVSEQNHSVGLMISTWETMENWRTWVGSKGMLELLQRARTSVTYL
jgi:heme-degrading monooxygenase HmoA